MTPADLTALEALVRAAAQAELVPRFGNTLRQQKRDGSWVTEADLAMQAHLASALAARYPDIALLGEEMSAAEQARLLAEAGGSDAGLWVLDPLDGTSNFAAGIPLFSVSLALMRRGRIEAGVVYDPSRDESFAALRGFGATLDGRPLRTPEAGVPINKATACVDFKRLTPALGARLGSAPPYSSQRAIGTVALEWCWVAAGRFHLYLHGQHKLWDYAAGCLVLEEAGGCADTLDGRPAPLDLAPRSAACASDPQLFGPWLAYLRSPAPG